MGGSQTESCRSCHKLFLYIVRGKSGRSCEASDDNNCYKNHENCSKGDGYIMKKSSHTISFDFLYLSFPGFPEKIGSSPGGVIITPPKRYFMKTFL